VKIQDFKLLEGQQSPLFLKRSKKHVYLKNMAFSLVSKEDPQKSLDVVCKDKQEYEIWISALKYLIVAGPPPESSSSLPKLADLITPVETKTMRDNIHVANDVFMVGDGAWGQLGNGCDTFISEPVFIKSLLNAQVMQVVLGDKHTVAIDKDGDLWSCGYGGSGRLGVGHTAHSLVPIRVPCLEVIVSVSCGGMHSLAVSRSGGLFAWGSNLRGQLGIDHVGDVTTPCSVSISQVVAASAGAFHSFAIVNDKSLYSWGAGDYGTLGRNYLDDSLVPCLVRGLEDVSIIVSGSFHAVAVDTKGCLYTWGFGSSGCLGHGNFDICAVPKPVSWFKDMDAISVAAGVAHTVTVMRDRKTMESRVYSFGAINGPQSASRNVPVPTLMTQFRDENIRQVSCGAFHSAAITNSGDKIYIWDVAHELPLVINGLEGKVIRSVNCGGSHTCVMVAKEWLRDSETLSCMACLQDFTFVHRRHHCRRCGGIFCAKCTCRRHPLLYLGHIDPVRVCDPCFDHLVRE